MAIRASAEDYLETILLLTKRNGAVRSIDIVGEMGFSKPSVSVAMKKLREGDYIKMEDDGHITLTSKGETVATQVYDRHLTLYNWLADLGVPDDIAAADACLMEHILHEESFDAIKQSRAATTGAQDSDCPFFGTAKCGNPTFEKFMLMKKQEEAAEITQ
jgi:Mn-dependent DtxR family transcriptional regulator